MSNLIFNLRVWKYHLTITDEFKIRINRNTNYSFKDDPFIWLFEYGNKFYMPKKKQA